MRCLLYIKTPTACQSFVGVFFLSFEFIIQIICYDPCKNRTNDNCYDEKCNVHLYITPPLCTEVLSNYNKIPMTCMRARILYVTSKYDISITSKQVNKFTCLLVYLFTNKLVYLFTSQLVSA